jgi:hypothetical protein
MFETESESDDGLADGTMTKNREGEAICGRTRRKRSQWQDAHKRTNRSG